MMGFLRNRTREPSAAPPRSDGAEMPFLDHLEELRWRVIWSLLAVIVGTLIGLVLVIQFNALQLIIRPIEPLLDGGKLHYLSPADPFFVTLKLAVIVGLLLSFPVVVQQFWVFLAPALSPKEKRAIITAIAAGLLLFVAGVALAYFVALPVTLKFFMGFQTETLQQNITIGHYGSLVIRILLVFGLVFELPVVLAMLGWLGLVSSRFLAEKRRIAIASFAIGASIITPGDTLTLTIFMMVPLMLLYELSIGVVALIERRRARALAELQAEAEFAAD
jgi:sec-independent protein translocase protein TatC